MAFKSVNFDHLARFNSSASSDFLDMYEAYLDKIILEEDSEPSSKTIAPSSFRCARKTWFRLRGVNPDQVKTPDRVLDFTARIGEACHRLIQGNLIKVLGDNWIPLDKYLEEHSIPYKYTITQDEGSYESKIELLDIPLRFAVDGVVFWKGEYYLLEIKSSEFSSFNELTDPKPQHVDQTKLYCSILGINKILYMYIDRQYGTIKCYEKSISETDRQSVLDRVKYIIDMAEANLAPERLPRGDAWCSPGHCPYFKKCNEWGG